MNDNDDKSTYNFNAEVKAGAVGTKAQGVFVDKNGNVGIENFQAFSQELQQLKKALTDQAGEATVEQLKELTYVAEAAEEAEKGNKEKAFAALKSVGQWTVNTGTKIGTTVVTEYLKQRYGL